MITKSIVEEHGGTIRVTSMEGRGTTVVVTIPLSASVDVAEGVAVVAS